MHNSEFEKQVQQKMQELKFAPGTDVWARVQADLQKKKRRRPVVLWFLLAGLLVGGSWILYTGVLDSGRQDVHAGVLPINKTKETAHTEKTNGSADTNNIEPKKNTTQQQATAVSRYNKSSKGNRKTNDPAPELIDQTAKHAIEQPTVSRPVQTSETNTGAPTSVEPLKKDPVESSAKSDNETAKKDETLIKDDAESVKKDLITVKDNVSKNNITPKKEQAVSSKDEPITAKKEEAVTSKDEPVTSKNEPVIAKKDEAVAQKKDETVKDETLTPKDENAATKKDETATAMKDKIVSIKDETASAKKDPSAAMKNKTQKNAAANKIKWQWGLTAGAGISDLGRQLFKPATVADFALSNSNAVSPNPGSPNRRPSDVQAGTAWNAGAYISKNAGKKLALKLGLNYELYSNSIKVGAQVNSARFVNQGTDMKMVEQYYTSGTTTNYNNKYHFVSMPLSLQWKVIDRAKHGIVWENGINVSRLIKTTALHFDGITGTYYKDDNIFKKTQLMLSSSVLFTIKSKSNPQLYAGPHVQYGLSNLVSKDAGSNRHLRYAGLKLVAGFNKK